MELHIRTVYHHPKPEVDYLCGRVECIVRFDGQDVVSEYGDDDEIALIRAFSTFLTQLARGEIAG